MELPNLENRIYYNFPFDAIKVIGNEAVDFFHRISTNDFSNFHFGQIQKTLFISDKGRIIDVVWILHQEHHLLLFVSKGMAEEIIAWLNKYIIMEDIQLKNITSETTVDLFFNTNGSADYFGFPVSFLLKEHSINNSSSISDHEFEKFRILNGIPKTKKELRNDFNPLELNLWKFISFTKGCYIGQEIIARLDTYNKIQRSLCYFTSKSIIEEDSIILNDSTEIGKVTSAVNENGITMGLAVIKQNSVLKNKEFELKDSQNCITIKKIFTKN
jgi:folate-binding protein YgfZ